MKTFLIILAAMLFVLLFGGWASAQAQDAVPLTIVVAVDATPTPLCPEPDAVWHYFQRGFDAPQCVVAKPALNQISQDDVTPEPTEEMDTSTPVVEPTAAPLSNSDKVTFSWTVVSQVMLAVIVSFMAGGFTVGGGILLALRTILKNPLLSNMVEKLFLSQPPDRIERERGVIAGIKEIAQGVDKLTDGVLEPETKG